MRAVFADTYFWIALADVSDGAHERALSMAAEYGNAEFVTTDEVLVEYLTFFAGADERLRSRAVQHVKRVLESPGVRVVPQTRNTFLEGLALFDARPDKGYSLTDCISMQTMRREGLTEVLTNDRHFSKEGFRALFRGGDR
jgi:predicted nucleic acid-binding protein